MDLPREQDEFLNLELKLMHYKLISASFIPMLVPRMGDGSPMLDVMYVVESFDQEEDA